MRDAKDKKPFSSRVRTFKYPIRDTNNAENLRTLALPMKEKDLKFRNVPRDRDSDLPRIF